MKTNVLQLTKCLAIMLMVIAITAGQAKGSVLSFEKSSKDTTFKTFNGKVVDATTKKPVIYANVYLIGSSLGVVTNDDGDFILKVPIAELGRKVGISNIGYKTVELSLSELGDKANIIKLETAAVQMDEVVIRSDDPRVLVNMALNRVNQNYRIDPEMLIGFYRETIKQNRSYVAVSEAVLDVYKSSYTSLADYDRVKIFKGRKSEDVKKMDTLMFKLQGGPRTSFLLDIVKNPGAIFSEDYLDDYYFSNAGYATIDGRDNYVIEFYQRESVPEPLYKGIIYLDTENMAFSRIEFSFSDQALSIADNELVRKKPIDLKVDVLGASYLVNYRLLDGKWYLNHVRSDLAFKCLWKKKRYNSTYNAVLEMAVTDRTDKISKAKYKEQSKMTDIFADEVNQYKDENFWGEYNYIKPDESIETVINRLNKKLKWETIGDD
jgi:hypothetical protein